jgi:hypothetical protein
MESFLSFLKTATIEEVDQKAVAAPRRQNNPNPTFLGIRVWKDGSLYPSQAAVDQFSLEYKAGKYIDIPGTEAVGKPGEPDYVAAKPAKRDFVPAEAPGFGFDFIDSREWGSYKGDRDFLFLGLVPKTEAKVDIFGITRYDAAGKPLSSVVDQGSATFGKEVLIPSIEAVYGIKFQRNGKEATAENEAVIAQDGVDFVDLLILEEAGGVNIQQQFGKAIIHSPKRVVRGTEKGKANYQRRENMPLFLLFPAQLLEEEQTVEAVPDHIDVKETVAVNDSMVAEALEQA